MKELKKLKKKLAKLAIDYVENHEGKDNINQRTSLEYLKAAISSFKAINGFKIKEILTEEERKLIIHYMAISKRMTLIQDEDKLTVIIKKLNG